jgi:hypothetical protein
MQQVCSCAASAAFAALVDLQTDIINHVVALAAAACCRVSANLVAGLPKESHTGCGSTAGAGPGTTRPSMVSMAAAMPSAARMSCCSSEGVRSCGSTPGGRSIRMSSSVAGPGAGAGAFPAAVLPCK